MINIDGMFALKKCGQGKPRKQSSTDLVKNPSNIIIRDSEYAFSAFSKLVEV